MSNSHKYCVEDFPFLHQADFRRIAGGRKKFNAADFCSVELADGQVIKVPLIRVPGNIAGDVTYLCCPACGNKARKLFLAPPHGLMCRRCLHSETGAIYATQRFAPGHSRYPNNGPQKRKKQTDNGASNELEI